MQQISKSATLSAYCVSLLAVPFRYDTEGSETKATTDL
jgi:hypothetical protein